LSISSVDVAKADSSSKIFPSVILSVFHFLLCRLTTEAMGIGGMREHSLS